MRVAHSGASNLKNLPNLPKIDPCSEPWRRVTFVVRNWIFIVLTLHARSYQCGMNHRLDLHTLVTLTCQIQVEYRWNTSPAGQFFLIAGVPCYTYNIKCPVSKGLNFMCVFRYNLVTLLFNYIVWRYEGRSQRDVKLEKSSKFGKNGPVQRAVKKGYLCRPERDIYGTYSTCT